MCNCSDFAALPFTFWCFYSNTPFRDRSFMFWGASISVNQHSCFSGTEEVGGKLVAFLCSYNVTLYLHLWQHMKPSPVASANTKETQFWPWWCPWWTTQTKGLGQFYFFCSGSYSLFQRTAVSLEDLLQHSTSQKLCNTGIEHSTSNDCQLFTDASAL